MIRKCKRQINNLLELYWKKKNNFLFRLLYLYNTIVIHSCRKIKYKKKFFCDNTNN